MGEEGEQRGRREWTEMDKTWREAGGPGVGCGWGSWELGDNGGGGVVSVSVKVANRLD